VALVRLAERVDRFLGRDSLPTAEEMDHLVSSPECEHLGFRGRDFEKLWDELRQVKLEAELIFR
jgi:hypothetical protein